MGVEIAIFNHFSGQFSKNRSSAHEQNINFSTTFFLTFFLMKNQKKNIRKGFKNIFDTGWTDGPSN